MSAHWPRAGSVALPSRRNSSTERSSRTQCFVTPQASRLGSLPSAGAIMSGPEWTAAGVPLPSHDARILELFRQAWGSPLRRVPEGDVLAGIDLEE